MVNRDDNVLLPIIGLLIMLLCLLCHKAQAQEQQFHLLELDKLSMEYRQVRNYRDAYFPQYETIEGECVALNSDGSNSVECFKYGANMLFDLDLIKYGKYGMFWRNDIQMDATNRQVRHVGWKWELGFPLLFDKDRTALEVFTRHHSRHLLDSDPQVDQKYPLRDEYVVRLNFYERNK